MAFGQANFLPHTSNFYIMDAALNWFIYKKKPVGNILLGHQLIGAHTDIYIFNFEGKDRRYLWSHPGRQPFGAPAPIQCPECRSLAPWHSPKVSLSKNPPDISKVHLACRNCTFTLDLTRPEQFVRVGQGEVAKSDRGDWYYEEI